MCFEDLAVPIQDVRRYGGHLSSGQLKRYKTGLLHSVLRNHPGSTAIHAKSFAGLKQPSLVFVPVKVGDRPELLHESRQALGLQEFVFPGGMYFRRIGEGIVAREQHAMAFGPLCLQSRAEFFLQAL